VSSTDRLHNNLVPKLLSEPLGNQSECSVNFVIRFRLQVLSYSRRSLHRLLTFLNKIRKNERQRPLLTMCKCFGCTIRANDWKAPTFIGGKSFGKVWIGEALRGRNRCHSQCHKQVRAILSAIFSSHERQRPIFLTRAKPLHI